MKEVDEKNHEEAKNITLTEHTLRPATEEKKQLKNKYVNTGHKRTWVKPVMITVLSAVVIGSALGLLMLYMFTNLGDVTKGDDQEVANVHADRLDKDEKQTSLVTLQAIGAYVIQAGVFSEVANADEWTKKYAAADFSPVVFERDKQYFLFVGLADTEKGADQLATTLEASQFEVYVKEWQTKQVELSLTVEEAHWLNSFQEQWEDTLVSLTEKSEVSLRGWDDLLNSYPLDSKEIVILVESIHEFYKEDLKELSEADWQSMLLSTWQTYEQTLLQMNQE